jgi:hypothetical protein
VKWLLWLYPREWRRRYGEEFLALIEERMWSPTVVLDILRGAIDARLHPQLRAAPAAASASGAMAPRRRGLPFDRFTRRSRNVLRLAQEEAERLQHTRIGTEHLLLGLLLERDGVAAHVLAELGVDADGVRSEFSARLADADPPSEAQLGLTPDAKRAIELGVREANRLGHRFFGTEHLLLGLAAAEDGLGAEILQTHGAANVDDLRQRVIRVVNAGPKLSPPDPA